MQKKIILMSLDILNFKGISSLHIDFSQTTRILGRNASGKSSIFDAITWLLFDKDSSGKSKFQVRPVDADGRLVDGVEISVSAEYSIDGEKLVLGKIQRQKWVKRRGHEAQTFEGNENVFSVNGFPAKKTDYDAKIASLVGESLFNLLTDPTAFARLKPPEQYDILLKLVGGITDESILDAYPGQFDLIAEDILTGGVEKSRAKDAGILRDLKKEQAAYPIRIDEATRAIVEVNTWGLDQEKAETEKRLAEIRENRENLRASLVEMNGIQDEILKAKMEISSIEQKAQEEVRNSRYVSQKAYDDAVMGVRSLTDQYNRTADTLDQAKKTLEYYKADIKNEADNFKAIRCRVLSEDETTCPTCGRPFDAEKVEEIKKTFSERKQKDLEASNERGTALRGSIKVTEDKIAFLTETMASLKVQISDQTQKMDALKAVLESAPTEANMDGNSAYQEAVFRLSQLQSRLSTMDNGESRRMAIDAAERDALADLRDIDERLAMAKTNEVAIERVNALKEAQMECGQKVANQEQRLYLLEEFSKLKRTVLVNEINSHFTHVRFKLFDEQINGGVNETCTMQINSNGSYVDYWSANRSAQILGGLDVINTLGQIYGVSAPVVIDNAEAINVENVPKMDAQMILLYVSDDEKLTVKGEK